MIRLSWAPYHLTTDVELESLEGKALSEYFSRGMGMPSDLDLQSIHRVENKSAWQIHKIHRNEVYKQFEQGGHASEGFEMWLWHGSAEIDSIAKQGFHRAFMSLHNNRYGPGFYFAPDPRVSSGGKPSKFLQQSFKWVHDSSIWHMAIPLNCSKHSLNWTCCTVTGFAQNFNRRDPQSDLHGRLRTGTFAVQEHSQLLLNDFPGAPASMIMLLCNVPSHRNQGLLKRKSGSVGQLSQQAKRALCTYQLCNLSTSNVDL